VLIGSWLGVAVWLVSLTVGVPLASAAPIMLIRQRRGRGVLILHDIHPQAVTP